MKIKVIGSGDMWTPYNSAAYLIDEDILVDMPNGTCKNLFKQGINPRNISYVLLTHFHGDHYFDIPFYFLLKSKANNPNVNIYCSKEGKRKNKLLLKLAFPKPAQEILNTIKPIYNFQNSFTIKDYNVTKYLVDHGRMKPAYGYVFSANNIKVGFTGDTTLCPNVEYVASICNYLFCDCTLLKGNTKHMGIDMINKLSKDNPNCQFIVSHLEDSTREVLLKNKKDNIIIPNDGDEINIS